MTSTAISAQNSSLSVATGTGGAKTISSIAPGNPTIITSAAHGLSNGSVANLAAIGGTMAALLNGQSPVITNVTTNTFAVQLDTTGLTYTSGGTATPVTYTEVENIKSFTGFDGATSEIDVTNLRSTAKESRPGLQDFGKFSVDVNPDFAAVGQNAVRVNLASGALVSYKLTLPNGKVASFTAYVKSAPWQGGVDAVISGSFEFRITGSVTIA